MNNTRLTLALALLTVACSSSDAASPQGAAGAQYDASTDTGSGGASGGANGGAAGAGGHAGGAGTTQGGSAGAPDWWKPTVQLTWQWQLDGEIDTTVDAQVFDVDLVETDASVVTALHAKGAKVICYMSAGSWEDWRPDKDQFPQEVIGKDYPGWAGEKFIDIRAIDKIGPVMKARMDLCKSKGFDGLEPDNIDTFEADTGFPLTAQDQLTYNQWLASEAHARGLSIGLKNDSEQAAALEPSFDWTLTEDCFDQGWCADVSVFVSAGKPVLMCEYDDTGIVFADACTQASQLQLNAILKHRNLDGWRQVCQ